MVMGNTFNRRSSTKSKRWTFCYIMGSLNRCLRRKLLIKGHYYAGKHKGYKYLNDTYILNVNTNRWSVNK